MDEVLAVVPGAHEAFAAACHAAGDTVCTAGSANHEAHIAAAAGALGAIGAPYLAAHAPAQANCLAATLQVGQVFHALGAGTTSHKAATISFDSAC